MHSHPQSYTHTHTLVLALAHSQILEARGECSANICARKYATRPGWIISARPGVVVVGWCPGGRIGTGDHGCGWEFRIASGCCSFDAATCPERCSSSHEHLPSGHPPIKNTRKEIIVSLKTKQCYILNVHSTKEVVYSYRFRLTFIFWLQKFEYAHKHIENAI